MDRNVEAGEQRRNDAVGKEDPANLDDPERNTVDDVVPEERDRDSEGNRDQTEDPLNRSCREGHPRVERADDDHRCSAHQQGQGAPTEVGREVTQIGRDGPEEVRRDVARAHAIGELAPAPHRDRAEQHLAPPCVGRHRALVVATHRRPGTSHRAHEDRGSDDAEDGVGDYPGRQGQPVGRLPPEPGPGQQPVGP